MTTATLTAPRRGYFDLVDDWLKRDQLRLYWLELDSYFYLAAYMAIGGWLTGTTFVTSWYTHGLGVFLP